MADPEQDYEMEVQHGRLPAPPEHTRESEHKREHPQQQAQRLASNIGNKNFTQVVARMQDGEGIMHDGTVHPDVQAAIATFSGKGSGLDKGTLSRLQDTHGDLSDARVHTGKHADHLARSVNAVAFTVGQDMFFREGAYDPNSGKGQELIAHESAHVVQQRGAPRSGPLKVSQPGDTLEREADAAARDVAL